MRARLCEIVGKGVRAWNAGRPGKMSSRSSGGGDPGPTGPDSSRRPSVSDLEDVDLEPLFPNVALDDVDTFETPVPPKIFNLTSHYSKFEPRCPSLSEWI